MQLWLRFRLDLAMAALLGSLVSGASVQSDVRGANRSEPAPAVQARTPAPARNPTVTAPPNVRAPSTSPTVRAPAGLTAPTAGEATSTLESARQRWERLTPEQKVRARERYEKYLALSETERRELAERAQRLKENSARVERELSPEVRERLATLEPEKRQELIGELVEGVAKEKGQRIREMLPENVLKRLEAARPEDRARYLAEFKLKQRRRVARFAIDQFGRRLKLPPAEVERLKDLPEEERAQAVLELRKQLSEREAQEFGLPPGISRLEWDAWEKLPPEEFFEVMQRYQHMRAAHAAAGAEERDTVHPPRDAAHPSRDAAHPQTEGPDREQGAQKTPPSAGHEEERGADARSLGDAASVPSKEARDARVSPERLRALHELSEARRLRPGDFLDLANLSKVERAIRVERRRRERCLAAIRAGELLPPERIAELAQAPDAEFFRQVRILLAR